MDITDYSDFYLKALLETLDKNFLLTITDINGTILKVNKLFCEVSEYSEEELIGQNHSIVNSGYHTKEFWTFFWKTILSGNRWKGEICNKSKSGNLYWVDTTIHPIQNEAGEIIQFLSIRHLITDKVQIRNRLIRKNYYLERFRDTIRQELLFAESIQKYLLPSVHEWKGIGLKAYYWYAPLDRVSGDIFDYFLLDNKKIRIFMADACGHGLKAGFQTMSIQTEYQRIKDDFQSPEWILYHLNQSIFKIFKEELIQYTCIIIDLDLDEGKLRYCNAGHPEPLLFIKPIEAYSKYQILEVTHPLLGFFKDIKIDSKEMNLPDEFLLVIYSDGIPETLNPEGELYCMDRFVELIRESKGDCDQILHDLPLSLSHFRKDKPILDDRTLILMEKNKLP